MGYLERLVIGVIVTISAYSLLQDATQRYHFHRIIAQLSTSLQIDQCYSCTESLRIVLTALTFTAGITLVFDICTVAALIGELIIVAYEAAKIKDCSCICSAQNLLIHLLFFIILFNNWREIRASQKQQKSAPSRSKSQPQRKRAQPQPYKKQEQKAKQVGKQQQKAKEAPKQQQGQKKKK